MEYNSHVCMYVCMYVCTFIKHFSSTTIHSLKKKFVTFILMSFALGVPLAEECTIPQNLLVNKGTYMYTVQFSYNFTLLWQGIASYP